MHSIKFILLLLAISLAGQNVVQFKGKTLPEKSYDLKTSISMDGYMDFSGPEEKMEKMKAEGLELPVKMKMVTEMEMKYTSGRMNPDKSIPLVTEIIRIDKEIEVGGKKQETKADPTVGLKIYATQKDTSTIIDSIGGKDLPEEYKALFKSLVGTMNEAFKGFPNKAIRVGEKFKVSLPISLPMPMVGNLNMTNQMEYKLVKVEKGIAYLEYTYQSTIDLEKNSKEFSFSGGGTGKGVMQYHIANGVLINNTTNMKMDMKIGMKDMEMTMVSDATSAQSIQIK